MTKKTISDAITNISTEYIEKAADYTAAKKTRKPVWVKWVSMAACLCLVIFGVWYMTTTNSTNTGTGGIMPGGATIGAEDSINSDDKNYDERYQDAVTAPSKADNANIIVINEAGSIATADMDAQISHLDTLSGSDKEMMLKQFEADIGLNYDDFIAKIPDSFASRFFYSMDVPADSARTEYIPHDYVFEYQTKNGGEVRISICAKEKPLRDCFVECDNPEQSEINGVPVTIYGFQGSYLIYFSHENINYDIDAKNITQAELEELLKSILE